MITFSAAKTAIRSLMVAKRRISDGPLTTAKVFDWFTHLTWPKMILATVAAVLMLTIYTLYENRQKVFDFKTSIITEDFMMEPPSKAGREVFEQYLRLHPEVSYISVLDANPITNERMVIARFYNDKEIKAIVETQVLANPTISNSSLMTADPVMNKQVLAILAGEFYCDPAQGGFIAKAFPEVAKRLVYSCRVPLPPAFNKATGWITLHLNKWPLEDLEKFKVTALTLGLTYYTLDISKQQIKMGP